MSSQKLVRGIVIGAVVGGCVALLDRETRNEVWGKFKETGTNVRLYIKNPSDAIHSVREGYEELSANVSTGIEGALSVLTQVQQTLDAINDRQEGNGHSSKDQDHLEIVK